MTQLPLFQHDLPEVTSPKLWLVGRILWIAVVLRAGELPFNRSSGDQRSRSGGLSLECKKDLSTISIQKSKSRFDKTKKQLELDEVTLPIGRLLVTQSSDMFKHYLHEASLMHRDGMDFVKNEALMLQPSNNNDPSNAQNQSPANNLRPSPENPLNPYRDLPG